MLLAQIWSAVADAQQAAFCICNDPVARVVRKKGTDESRMYARRSSLQKVGPNFGPKLTERDVTGRNKMDPALPKVVAKQV